MCQNSQMFFQIVNLIHSPPEVRETIDTSIVRSLHYQVYIQKVMRQSAKSPKPCQTLLRILQLTCDVQLKYFIDKTILRGLKPTWKPAMCECEGRKHHALQHCNL